MSIQNVFYSFFEIGLLNGIGYYHMDTREAYQALLSRIDNRLVELRNEYECWYKCFLCGMLGILCKDTKDSLNMKIEECESIREILKLRLSSSGPTAELNISDDLLKKAKKGTNNSDLYSGPYFLSCGGGCGSAAYVDCGG